MQVGDHAAAKARAQPVFNAGKIGWGFIGGNHNLLAGIHQRIEGVEKLFLRIVLADQELQIIHHQHINRTQRFLEFHGGLAAQCCDEAIHEFFRAHIGNLARGVLFANGPGNGVHQMRFAKPNATIKEQWIKARHGRPF